MRIYVNQTKNRITFRIKKRYYLEPLMPGTMKLLGSTKSKTTKDENGENVPRLEITEDSRVFYKFVSSKQYGQLLNI